MKKKMVLIIIILILCILGYVLYRVYTGSLYFGNEYNLSYCQSFVQEVAVNFEQPDLCNKISSSAIGSVAGFNPPGIQITYARSDCFGDIAKETGDTNLCTQVKPASTLFLDGSGNNEGSCQFNVSVGTRDMHMLMAAGQNPNLDKIMQQLGYTPADMKLKSINIGNWADYLDAISLWYRVDQAQKRDPSVINLSTPYQKEYDTFIQRVNNLTCQ
jgi:hypothetical protein